MPKALKRVAKKFPFSDHGFFLSSSFLRGGIGCEYSDWPIKGSQDLSLCLLIKEEERRRIRQSIFRGKKKVLVNHSLPFFSRRGSRKKLRSDQISNQLFLNEEGTGDSPNINLCFALVNHMISKKISSHLNSSAFCIATWQTVT